MAASVSERAAELAPLYNAILYAFDDGEDWDPERIQQIQAVGYKLRQMIEEQDMAYWTRVPPGQARVHPENRDGEMLSPVAVWELLCIVVSLNGLGPQPIEGRVG